MSHNLESLLAPLEPFAHSEEVVINRPNEAWVWQGGEFQRHAIAMGAEDIIDLAHVAAAQRRRDVGADSPLLGTDLELANGDLLRFQVILPPCVRDGMPAMALRRASESSATLDLLDASGLFLTTKQSHGGPTKADRELLDLYRAGQWLPFLKAIVRYRKTVVLCGATGAGKTHVAKAMLREVPLTERLNTISDTDELSKLPHRNAVHSFYAKDGERGRVRALQLVEAHLRMRIGRPIINEIRDGEAALAFLRMNASGHPGGITTMHAPSARGALNTLRIMLKQTDEGRAVSDQDLVDRLRESIDVIIHCDRSPENGFGMPEVYFAASELVLA